MMKKVWGLSIIALVLFSCGTKQQKENQETTTDELTVISVDKVLSNTKDYVEKELVVEGLVNHVCSHSGKRMFILGENPDKTLRITPNEKIGVFEKRLEGNTVRIKGVLKELIIDEDYVAQLEKEVAEGMDNEALHDHSGGDHDEEEESADDSSKIKQIEQMKADIAQSENGFDAQYWLEASEVEVVETDPTEKVASEEDVEEHEHEDGHAH
ncbi:MAG TPA: hypothetical protein VJ896_02385 [Bacteroidales bacterium]|nr:hypothetical protein [Bacteroidales bacterium]